MEKSFRDILSQFLEGNEQKSPSSPSDSGASSGNHGSVSELDWTQISLGKTQNIAREAASRYKTKTAAPATEPTLEATAPEILIPLEKLDKDSRIMVGILRDLGATTEFSEGISLARVKKAYRRLVKKYHPDRLASHSSPKEREAAKQAFFRLQKAYNYLNESLAADLVEAA